MWSYCIVQGTLLSVVATWMGGAFEGEWTHVYMAESLAVHVKISQHC